MGTLLTFEEEGKGVYFLSVGIARDKKINGKIPVLHTSCSSESTFTL